MGEARGHVTIEIFHCYYFLEHVLYRHVPMRTRAMLLFLVTLKIFKVCTVAMGVACPLL